MVPVEQDPDMFNRAGRAYKKWNFHHTTRSLAWTDGSQTASNMYVTRYNSISPPFGLMQLDGTVHTHSHPGRNECTQCHALAPGGVLGLQAAQMNRAFYYGDRVDNQLRARNHIGLFRDTLSDFTLSPRLPNPTDPSHSLQDRS